MIIPFWEEAGKMARAGDVAKLPLFYFTLLLFCLIFGGEEKASIILHLNFHLVAVTWLSLAPMLCQQEALIWGAVKKGTFYSVQTAQL